MAKPTPEPKEATSLLSKSAKGASFLIILQVLSRALTFGVNQLLLRYLAPELLGVATQLELYSITVLFFARESLRVAIQRQSDDSEDQTSDKTTKKTPKNSTSSNDDYEIQASSSAGKSQTVVNLSYISMLLGTIFAPTLSIVYTRLSDAAVLDTPFFPEALKLFGMASIYELLAEPFFVVAQQKGLFKSRAKAESLATVGRCFVTCGTAVWASKSNLDFGVMPFALGQLTFSLILPLVYFFEVKPVATSSGFGMGLRQILSSVKDEYVFSYWNRGLLFLGLSLFLQTVVKHVLTQGDTILISSLATPQAIGIYALASNYGGLIARMVFQPIEEMSRSYFGKALSSPTTPPPQAVQSASRNLHTLLRFYSLISVCAVALGPTLAPLLLKIVAGARWSATGAGDVLATYCYYIPLLAINGVTESFIAAVATREELDHQSAWMLAFSIGFAGAGFVFLKVLDLGAEGLVWANVINMLLRIIWSSSFISRYLSKRGSSFDIAAILPTGMTIATGIATAAVMHQLRNTFTGGLMDLIKSGAVSGVFVLALAICERKYLVESYKALRPQQKS